MASTSAAAGLLSRQLKQMQNDKSISGISCGLVDSNVFEWEVMLMIDDDTKFYGGASARISSVKSYQADGPQVASSVRG
jgi:ubiquitin-conjugating enzyme E2 G1